MTVSLQSGDILLAATDVDDRHVDLRNHSGAGRILHLDAGLRPKGELRTGQTGLVVGLGIDPTSGWLYACDPGSQTVTVFGTDGACRGIASLLPRARIGSIAFDAEGRFVAGLHSRIGEKPEAPAPRLYAGSFATGQIEPLAVEIDGGRFGFHCVTHMSLAPDGRTLFYVSEGGRRLMRYDLLERRQLPDLLRLAPDDPRGTYGPAALPDGRVLMATGAGAVLIDADGRIEAEYTAEPARGWSRLTLALDARSWFLSNFVEGVLEQRSVDGGAVQRRHDIERRYSLSGLAEVP
jgi:hypothetical protein